MFFFCEVTFFLVIFDHWCGVWLMWLASANQRVKGFGHVTLPATNNSHLKNDGWNTSFPLGWPISGALAVSFRECSCFSSESVIEGIISLSGVKLLRDIERNYWAVEPCMSISYIGVCGWEDLLETIQEQTTKTIAAAATATTSTTTTTATTTTTTTTTATSNKPTSKQQPPTCNKPSTNHQQPPDSNNSCNSHRCKCCPGVSLSCRWRQKRSQACASGPSFVGDYKGWNG